MKQWFFRLMTWSGICSVMGPGSSIHNEYDMLFQVGGIIVMSIGFIGLLISSRKSANHTKYRTRQQRIRDRIH